MNDIFSQFVSRFLMKGGEPIFHNAPHLLVLIVKYILIISCVLFFFYPFFDIYFMGKKREKTSLAILFTLSATIIISYLIYILF